ncbi:MAG: ClpXP protease specificity-enhancing factor [Azonexus sp.]|jgi:stringent starvation protein B|nr:ClpXP protease specificity-enhancing factor [Azonexus sp.]
MELPSTKPYLLRALWEWCCDNGFTPHIVVQLDGRTRVPREFVKNGQIVLNIGPDATNKLQMGNELIEFQARFGGVARQISVPVDRVAMIYARENQAGMAFEIETGGDAAFGNAPAVENGESASAQLPPEPAPPAGGRPKLQRIK